MRSREMTRLYMCNATQVIILSIYSVLLYDHMPRMFIRMSRAKTPDEYEYRLLSDR